MIGGWAPYVASHVSQDYLTHRVAWLGYSGCAGCACAAVRACCTVCACCAICAICVGFALCVGCHPGPSYMFVFSNC